MASLLNMSGGSLLNKGLPYDAEIEYLQSDGNAYINSGVQAASTLTIVSKWQSMNNDGTGGYIYGARYANLNKAIGAVVYGRTATSPYSMRIDYSNVEKNTGSLNSRDVTLERTITQTPSYTNVLYGQSILSVNYSNYTVFSGGNYIYLFCINNNGTAAFGVLNNGYRCYYFQAYDNNNNLLVDLIPVRVGNVGYMYDKVSGQLFGNAGTGSFILGPNK